MGKIYSKMFSKGFDLMSENDLLIKFRRKNIINEEIGETMRDNDISKNGYSIELVDDSKTHLIGRISGPPNTQYSGGIFEIGIVLGDGYPVIPPVFKFFTNIWHPNISSLTGTIRLDALNYKWNPYMSLSNVLLMIQSLLSAPEPNIPQDSVVAYQYLNEPKLFDKTARYWTYIFSVDEEYRQRTNTKEFEVFDELVINLMKAKNLSRDQSLTALSCYSWDFTKFYEL
jgi:ubiquitin-conjugating enzyme (huntingtin interacting protein 2)